MKLGRNQPCWCKSGMKYKKCHLNRAHEEPAKLHEIAPLFQDAYKKAFCCAPDSFKKDCDGIIVKAHSVTKSLSLKKISRDGHVYGFKITLQNMAKTNGKLGLELIGIKQASTFTGFCAKHDSSIFKKIEAEVFQETKEECFLHAYRALCKEYFTKRAAFSLMKLKSKLDAGKPPLEQRAYQMMASLSNIGVTAGLSDLLKRKALLDKMLETKNFSNLNSLIIKFEKLPAVMAAGGKNLVYDFDGEFLQDAAILSVLPSSVYYSSFSSHKSGYFIFSWIGHADAVCQKFIFSLKKVPSNKITNALIRFLFSACENLFVSPDWWESLDKDKQQELIGRMHTTTHPLEDYKSNYLCEDGIHYSDWGFKEFIELKPNA